jgi:hypothetical protein
VEHAASFFHPEDGSITYLKNADKYVPAYAMLYLRRQYSSVQNKYKFT